MRAAAPRAILAVLGLCLIVVCTTGCASETKRDYLSHLSTTIEPGKPSRSLTRALASARADEDDTAIAAVPEE